MTPTTANVFDLIKLYKEYFGREPFVVKKTNENPRGTIHYSKDNIEFNKIGKYGQDIWFPVELRGGYYKKMPNDKKEWEGINIVINTCTTAVNLVTNVVSTPVIERKGTVNEIVSIDDYKFTIRGFLIGKDRKVPEDQIKILVALKESTMEKSLHGGFVELFLRESCRIIITELEFPEVQGQSHWIRPFTMTCKSDFITDLEFQDDVILSN